MNLFGFGKDPAGPRADPGKPALQGADAPPLSRQEYAHTTGDAPDSTAMIPIQGASGADGPGDPTEAIAPVEAPPPVAEAPPQAASRPPARSGRSVLRLRRVEPYSITRLAFVVSVALMIVTSLAAAIFWLVLAVTGVWGEINQSVAALLSDDSASFDITDYLGFTQVVGGTLLVSGINVILMTALATVGAHLYNLTAALLGGVEVTFTDD